MAASDFLASTGSQTDQVHSLSPHANTCLIVLLSHLGRGQALQFLLVRLEKLVVRIESMPLHLQRARERGRKDRGNKEKAC